jgi:hypothetical protein
MPAPKKKTVKPLPELKRPAAGRPPSIYRREIAEAICQEIAEGTKSMREILAENPEYPTRATIWRWMREHHEFRVMFDEARKDQARSFIDDMHTIADDTNEDLGRSGLKIGTRKWVAERMLAKEYGPRIDHNHTAFVTSSNSGLISRMTPEEREVLRDMLVDVASRPDPQAEAEPGLIQPRKQIR